ncbi:MAG TPA: hypothetical protein VJ872_06570 [Nocardioides sp.]|nr:hypothetical protein [Nocardioides sp.]
MNASSPHPFPSRLHDLGAELLGPVRAPRGSLRHRVLTARSVVAYAGLLLTLVQVVVWLLIGVFSGSLDSPWFLWTTVPAATLVAILTAIAHWHRWWTSQPTDR